MMARRKNRPGATAAGGTADRPVGIRDQVFDMHVSGFAVLQIAQRTGYSREKIRSYLDDPTFREEVEQFRSARQEATGRKLEAASETAAVSLAEVARGFSMSQNGERVPIDPSIARERTRASVALLDRTGFVATTRVRSEGTTTTVVRQGPPVSDDDMARLQRLLDR